MNMRKFWQSFWDWYQRYYAVHIGIATFLFTIQLVHLIWLSLDVVVPRLGGESLFPVSSFWETFIILVDYTEIPALVSTSLVYINELRKGFSWKPFGLLVFVNSQWLHLFWITDEFLVGSFTGVIDTVLPFWLAWVALLIDYLEIPVIIDTVTRFIRVVRKKKTE